MGRSPTAREASLPTSSVKGQTAALFLEGATVAVPSPTHSKPTAPFQNTNAGLQGIVGPFIAVTRPLQKQDDGVFMSTIAARR